MADGERVLVERDASLWAIRLFMGREPRDEVELELHRGHPSLESLRAGFIRTREFRRYFAKVNGAPSYTAPLFLFEPPASPLVPWHFAPPTLADPVSQLCTAGQLAEPAYAEWCAALDLEAKPYRKLWEFTWIAAALRRAGMLRQGMRGLGFGVGQEPMPALLASHGVAVHATDAPPAVVEVQGWASTGQHTESLKPLHRPRIVPDGVFDRQVEFSAVDMNAIPDSLQGFDFCWSSCAFEHLGSIELGLRFVEESLRTLRPGGVAVHTTEFNLSSNDATFEAPTLVLFRKRDFERLFEHLVNAGHKPWPLNLYPGSGAMDAHIDLPPYSLPHLKLQAREHVTTSIGIVVQKGGSATPP